MSTSARRSVMVAPKSAGGAYFFFFFFAQYLYFGRPGVQVLYWLTVGGFGVWWLIDLFRIPSMVEHANTIRDDSDHASLTTRFFEAVIVLVLFACVGAALFSNERLRGFASDLFANRTTMSKQAAIREHRVLSAMTQEEVRQSKGAPSTVLPDAGGREYWSYADGTVVRFSNFGKVFEIQKVGPAPSPRSAAAQAQRATPSAGRVVEVSPVSGRLVEHDRSVGYTQSVGLGGGVTPRPRSTPSTLQSGTLNQPRR